MEEKKITMLRGGEKAQCHEIANGKKVKGQIFHEMVKMKLSL
jgi:hypothetical protein